MGSPKGVNYTAVSGVSSRKAIVSKVTLSHTFLALKIANKQESKNFLPKI